MADLQVSFSEISRLVEAVSVPVPSTPLVEVDVGTKKWKRGIDRLRLMVQAEGALKSSMLPLLTTSLLESPDTIRAAFQSFSEELMTASEGSDEAKDALKECERIIAELSPIPERKEPEIIVT
jgi:hypothetical protein